jgi:signal peptidase I
VFPDDRSKDFIKRVIGTPGDEIEIRNKKLYRNGKPVGDEPYAKYTEPVEPGPRDNFGPVTVPADHVFVMGDNRDHSFDSRFWGFVPYEDIKGKAFIIYWSYEAGREDYETTGAGETIKGLGSVFVHFFTRTRWDRMFHQIR